MDASSQFKDSLPTTPDRLMAVLTSLDISFTTHTHPPLRTVEDAKALRGDLQGAHIKNLYLRDRKKRNFLLVAEEDKPIDLKALPGLIGSDRLSFGSADRLFEMLGVRPARSALSRSSMTRIIMFSLFLMPIWLISPACLRIRW